ncbi:hypothetical protein Tsp_03602 [Trichinella spiralis]|uniref:hypothetical protein n=1 Tax=Trichinella spiralis TaxID=6334 RepID=UPI0001EFB9F7|nr:hypothetical protein Tsp_03602 [Trichinella spiralis]
MASYYYAGRPQQVGREINRHHSSPNETISVRWTAGLKCPKFAGHRLTDTDGQACACIFICSVKKAISIGRYGRQQGASASHHQWTMEFNCPRNATCSDQLLQTKFKFISFLRHLAVDI